MRSSTAGRRLGQAARGLAALALLAPVHGQVQPERPRPYEPPPWVVEISYARIPELATAEPVAALWHLVREREALRWRALLGGSGEAGTWLAGVRAANLTISDRHRPDRPGMIGELGGWCVGESSAMALCTALGRWPGRRVVALSDGVAFGDPDLPVDQAVPPPGWTIRLDGDTAAAMADMQLPIRMVFSGVNILQAIMPTGVTIRLTQAQQARWILGDARVARAVDPRRLAEFPPDLAAMCAIGIDGRGLGEAFDGLCRARPVSEAESRELGQLGEVLRAVNGTVLAGMDAHGGLCVSVPRSHALDLALAGYDSALADAQDDEVIGHNGCSIMRRRESWLFGPNDRFVQLWGQPAPAPALSAPPGAWCVAAMPAADLAQSAQAALARWGSFGSLPSEPYGMQWMDGLCFDLASDGDPLACLGRTLASPLTDIDTVGRAVADAGDARVVGTMEDGQLALTVTGAVAAWFPFAQALHQGSNILRYDCGLAHLAATMAALHARGGDAAIRAPNQGAFFGRAGGEGDPIARLRAAIEDFPVEDVDDAWRIYAEGGRLLASEDPIAQATPAAGTMLELTTVLDDPRLPSIAQLQRECDSVTVTSAQGMRDAPIYGEIGRFAAPMRQLGQSQVVLGDLRGLTLIARADRLQPSLDAGLIAPLAGLHGREWDAAVFAAAELALFPPRDALAALDHRLPADADSPHLLARRLLVMASLDLHHDQAMGWLHRTWDDWLYGPDDLAAALDALIADPPRVPVLTSGQLAMVRGIAPLTAAQRAWPALEHRLLVRGLILMLLGKEGRLPDDAAGAAAATGALVETVAGQPVPIRFLRCRDGGFILRLETASPDAGFSERTLPPVDEDALAFQCASMHLVQSPMAFAWHPLKHLR